MFKRLVTGMFCVMLMAVAATAKPLNLNEISEAVCRVNNSKGLGTGTVFSQDNTNFYILTNYHVVGNSQYVKVEFFRSGYKSNPLDASVVWRAYQENTDIDFAILAVNKGWFGNYPPRVIPLAPPTYQPKAGYYIAAVGCPQGRWANGWEGKIDGLDSFRVIFTPPPLGGQSGSGITVLIKNDEGEWNTHIGALLTWRIGKQGRLLDRNDVSDTNAIGGAIPISTLHKVMTSKKTFTPIRIPAHYKNVSLPSQKCLVCGKDIQEHAYGSDGKFHCVGLVDGKRATTVDPGVKILYWSGKDTDVGYYTDAQCPGGVCPVPPNYGATPDGLLFNRRRNPNPNPDPRIPPPNPNNPNPANPYGIDTIPTIPGIGEEKKPEKPEKPKDEAPTTPVVPTPDPSLANALRDLAGRVEQLAKDKEDAEKKANELALAANKSVATQAVEIIQENPVKVGLFAGILGGIVYLIWNKFVKKLVVKKLDTVEDLLQTKVTEKFGEEAGKQVREAVEGVETMLLEQIDNFLNSRRLASRVGKKVEDNAAAVQKEKFRGILGRLGRRKATSEDLLAEVNAVMNASEETEKAEQDAAGLAVIEQLRNKLKSLEKPTIADLQAVLAELAKHEKTENKDVEVIKKLDELTAKLSALAGNVNPPVDDGTKTLV